MFYPSLDEKQEVFHLLRDSLMRLCGGGILTPHDVHHDKEVNETHKSDEERLTKLVNTLDWKQRLETLAANSISFTNGKNKKKKTNHQPLVNGKECLSMCDENFGKGHDIESRIALSLFRRYSHSNNIITKERRSKQKKKSEQRPKMRDEDSNSEICPSIRIISDLGLLRCINSAQELATLLVNEMEDQLWHLRTSNEQDNTKEHENHSKINIMTIQIDDSGIICIVTRKRFHYLRKNDRFPCSHCIKWFKGQKGLWWHQQIVHNLDHSAATTVAATSSSSFFNKMAITLYQNPSNDFSINITEETNIKSQRDQEPFFESIKNGHYEEFLEYIQLKNYDPKSYLDKNGASALHWACGSGKLEIVKYLVEICQCTPDQTQKGKRSFHGRTPLHWSARNGHLNVVRYLVQDCNVDINAKTVDGTTAFCWAAWQGHLEIMKYLYLNLANVQEVNSFGCNAILWSAQGSDDSIDTIKFLESIGVDIMMTNSNGHGILHKSAQRGKSNICCWIVSRMMKDMRVYSSTYKVPLKPSKTCFCPIKSLAMIAPDKEGCCPSDLAGQANHDELARWLVDQEKKIGFEVVKNNSNEIPVWLENGIINSEHLANRMALDDQWDNGAAVKKIGLYISKHSFLSSDNI